MQNKRIRRLATPITAGAVVGITVFGGVPAQAAPTTTTFTASCLATPSAVAGPTVQSQPSSVTVDAPAVVNAGDQFDVVIAPPPITYPNSVSGASVQNVSRVKIDVEVPQNADYLGAEIVPGTGSGLSGVAPNLLRVNENGVVDPNGTILRLSGNNATIGNGPNSSKNSEGGIVAKASSGSDTTFQLPQVKAHLKAGASGNVDLKLRTSGDAGAWANDKNFLTFLPKATLVITAWAPTQCTPRDSQTAPLNVGAGPLATVKIQEADKATTTTLTGPAAAKNGTPITLTANVAPGANAGTVQFKDGGVPLGGAVTVANGSASISPTFTTDGDHSITAEYSGATGFLASTSAAKVVKVTTDAPPDATTTTTVTAPNNAKVGQDVNLTAKVDPAGSGGTVNFVVDDGAPIPGMVGTDGVAVAPYTFTTTGTHKVVAKFTGGAGFAPSTSLAFPVSVTTPAPADVDTTTTLAPLGTVEKNVPVVLKATVAPANARGTVQFKIGDALIGGPVDVVDGVATLPTTFVNSGTYNVTAEFTGAAGFTSSAAAPQTLTVPGATGPGDGGGGFGSLESLFGSSK
ncbi:Ig-like domain repeat protein [Rhodococcus spelaei]|uniref:Ig-like domain repeat protein n=1 Tax=Rhodococcus spelaei TaxID=2546320 RepID=A0A541BQZ1_9NOCA|nr:Ig-like domain-containing protein [Rhodococcus spelaei]TQF74729.1 Ig-like domain repeat protein [Rhodococcus spelaei]